MNQIYLRVKLDFQATECPSVLESDVSQHATSR